MKKREVNRLKARLRAAGVTYGEVARLARVSWRMVKFVVDGQRTSSRVNRAIELLIAAHPRRPAPTSASPGRRRARSRGTGQERGPQAVRRPPRLWSA